MPTYKTLEKSWILKVLRKESIFLNSKRHKLQLFSAYRDVHLFSCGLYKTLCRHLLKRQELNFFSFSLYGSNVKSEKIVTWKNYCFVWHLLQCKLNKVKVNCLGEWLDKYVCWQLISVLLSLMIITSQVRSYHFLVQTQQQKQ